MIRVAGGEHEGNFWSVEVTDAIIDFIEAHAAGERGDCRLPGARRSPRVYVQPASCGRGGIAL
jgi:hypothetical protein